MSAGPSESAALRGQFAVAVRRLMQAAADTGRVNVQETATDGVGHVGHRIEASPAGDTGFAVAVELGRTAVGVRCSVGEHAWSHDQILTGDPKADAGARHEALSEALGDALSMTAAALWGRMRIVIATVGPQVVSWRVAFGEGDRFVSFASIAAPGVGWATRLRAVLVAPQTRVHQNDVPPPKGVRPGPPSPSPTAPWSGAHPWLDPAAGEPRPMPVDGVIDLHTFKPKQVAPAVEAYIQACCEQAVTELRIIHGKGIGNLRRTVHALLDKHADVADYRLAGHGAGAWGATLVTLRKTADAKSSR